MANVDINGNQGTGSMDVRHIVTDEEIITEWNDVQTIKGVAKKLDISYHKVLKSLSSNNIIINDVHQKIMEYYNQGKSIHEISEIIHISDKVVQAYLPRTRPAYNVNQSSNALKIMHWRESKNKT